MRGKRSLVAMISFVFCLGVTIFIFSCNSAQASDNVISNVLLDVVDGVSFNVLSSADVFEVTLPANGVTYSKSEIQAISSNNPEMMGAIKYAVKDLISDQLEASFPYAVVSSLQELPTYSLGVFSDTYKVQLTNDFFSLNKSVETSDFINGMLDCGAIVNYSFPLRSFDGWNNTYVFQLPSNITYKKTNGDVQQSQITWKVLTQGAANEKIADVSLNYVNPSFSFFENTTMGVSFILNCTVPDTPILAIQYNAETINIDEYDVIPSFISNVEAIPADAVRLCVLNNFTSWDDIQNRSFRPVHADVKALVESSSFNQSLDMQFSWVNSTTNQIAEPYDKTNMNVLPTVSGRYVDEDIYFSILGLTSRALFGFVNAGAQVTINKDDVNFGGNLERLEYPYSGVLSLPKFVLLEGENEFTWDSNSNISGSFSSENYLTYDSQLINTTILLDVESTDMNLLSFFTGQTELTLGMYLVETQNRHVTSLSEEFFIPSKVNLSLFNADLFRLCVEENVFTADQVNTFLLTMADLFENRTKTLFPTMKGEARSDKDLFEDSLVWDKNISVMDDFSPVIISSSMHSSYPLSFSFALIPPAFAVTPQNLSFEGIPNQDVTYRMVFPKGTTVEIYDTLNRAVLGETDEGRVFFEVSFNASESDLVTNVHCNIHPSGLFIIGLLVPCIISIFITIILFVVVFIIRKKRRMMHSSYQEEAPKEYEDQEYYVPPPPPSKRKRK